MWLARAENIFTKFPPSASLWLWGLCASFPSPPTLLHLLCVTLSDAPWHMMRGNWQMWKQSLLHDTAGQRKQDASLFVYIYKSPPLYSFLSTSRVSFSLPISVNDYKCRPTNRLPGPIQGNWLSEQTAAPYVALSLSAVIRNKKRACLSGEDGLNYIFLSRSDCWTSGVPDLNQPSDPKRIKFKPYRRLYGGKSSSLEVRGMSSHCLFLSCSPASNDLYCGHTVRSMLNLYQPVSLTERCFSDWRMCLSSIIQL